MSCPGYADQDTNRGNTGACLGRFDYSASRSARSERATAFDADHDREGEVTTNTEDMEKVQEQLKGLEVGQATQAAALAGAQATQAAAHAGTWSTMLAGAGGLVVGIFLGIAMTSGRRR